MMTMTYRIYWDADLILELVVSDVSSPAIPLGL